MLLKRHIFILLAALSLLFSACTTEEKKTDAAESTFNLAQEYEKDERYEEAIRKYTEVKNRFPYSQYAIKAELAIADVYFKEESYGEAQINYQTFRELHPKHTQIDYVIFRIGLSYFNQLPETIDRDLTYAHDAISTFDELVEKYSQSEFVKEAKEKKATALKKLAEKEDYVGDFYFKRKVYDSALIRYEYLIKTYPQSELNEKALARAYYSALKAGEREKSKNYLNQLKKNYPNSKELSALTTVEEP